LKDITNWDKPKRGWVFVNLTIFGLEGEGTFGFLPVVWYQTCASNSELTPPRRKSSRYNVSLQNFEIRVDFSDCALSISVALIV
jgi:hypothetical protein